MISMNSPFGKTEETLVRLNKSYKFERGITDKIIEERVSKMLAHVVRFSYGLDEFTSKVGDHSLSEVKVPKELAEFIQPCKVVKDVSETYLYDDVMQHIKGADDSEFNFSNYWFDLVEYLRITGRKLDDSTCVSLDTLVAPKAISAVESRFAYVDDEWKTVRAAFNSNLPLVPIFVRSTLAIGLKDSYFTIRDFSELEQSMSDWLIRNANLLERK